MYKILFIGESWLVHTQETKGYDVFTFDYYEEAVEYIRDALTASGEVDFVHLPSHKVESDFPKTAEALAEYDAVMLSDCGANTMQLPMRTFLRLERTENKLELLRSYVAAGGALVMIGGYLTFQGIEAKGAYKNTPIEEVLPVTLLSGDDRVEKPQGVIPMVAKPDHPVLQGLPQTGWPYLLGYNRLLPKEGTEVLVNLGDDPMLVLGSYGKGRVCAYATDCSPHWSPEAFCRWEGYPTLWGNLVRWLAQR